MEPTIDFEEAKAIMHRATIATTFNRAVYLDQDESDLYEDMDAEEIAFEYECEASLRDAESGAAYERQLDARASLEAEAEERWDAARGVRS